MRRSGRSRATANPRAAAAAAASATAANSNNGRPLSQQQLLDVGASFVRLWFAGIAKGPQAVEQELSEVLDPAVTIMPDRVRLFSETQGFGEVLAELERAHLEYHRSEHRPMLYAASEEGQRVYALVEGVYQDVGALPGHPATFRVSKVHHILVLQVQGGRAVRLWLRRQLTEEDKDELLHDPLACYPSPFPRDSLRLTHAATHDAAGDKMADTISSWWRAWSTAPDTGAGAAAGDAAAPGQSASSSSGSGSGAGAAGSSLAARPARSKGAGCMSAAAAQLLATSFRWFDAYGLYPSMRGQGRRHLSKDSAVQYLERLRYSHHLTIEIIDVAVAEGSLACFTHWHARLQPKWPTAAAASSVGAAVGAAAVAGAAQAATGAGLASSTIISSSTQQQQDQDLQQAAALMEPADGSFLVDSLEADVFNEQLQLQDIWMFRGPISHNEVQLFLEFDRQQAATEAAQAEAAQEDVRSARRAQREQQLRELLAWMSAYQQQWGESVAHVQKALARQQNLAKAQQLLQKLGDQGFVVPPPEQLQQQAQAPAAAAAEGVATAPAAAAASATEAQQQQQGEQCRAAGSSGGERDIDSSRTWD